MKGNKDTLYIMAAGKSSRFGSPKILKTFKYNEKLFKKYFKFINIVTSPGTFKIIKNEFGDRVNSIITGDYGKGSGIDVNTVQKRFGKSIVCWSDAFFNEENIKAIVDNYDKYNNLMTVSLVEKPYVSIITEDMYMVGYIQNDDKKGYNDNSIFVVSDIDAVEDFMGGIKDKRYKCIETQNPCRFFNTKDEFFHIPL